MSGRRIIRWAALAIPLLLSLIASAASAAQSTILAIHEPTVAPIEAGPLWVSQATWDRGEENLVIADPGSGRIYVYDRRGHIRRSITNPGRGALEFTKPNYPARVGDRYLIATSMYQWVWFNQEFVAQAPWDLDWEEGARYSRLAVSEFTVGPTHLYAIGAAMDFDSQWSERAIFSIALADRTAKRIGSLSSDPEEISYYREPPFNLCSCGGKPWLLRMASTVSIVEARDGGKTLKSFPAEFRRRPTIPQLANVDSVRARHAALRNAPVAEGLFCADNTTLLLLTRNPKPGGGTRWLIHPIDPSTDTMAPAIELPTDASEIVFVPGEQRWGLLEKGLMKYPGVQPLTRFISFRVPGSDR